MSKITDMDLHTTRGHRVHRSQTLTREVRGIKFVKKANMFCAYHNLIQESKTYIRHWFSTPAEAQEHLHD